MGEKTGIEWTHHTQNFWRGCVKIAPECQFCYAEALSKRNPKNLGYWGLGAPRVIGADSYWQLPTKYDKAAKIAGERRRVFTNSLADFCEEHTGPIRDGKGTVLPMTLDDVRERAIRVIEATEQLDWLVLTKRPHRLNRCLPALANVWAGTSVGTMESARKFLPHLCASHHQTKFISVEPLLERLDLSEWLATDEIDWVIIGNESRGEQCGRLLTDDRLDHPLPSVPMINWLEAAIDIIEQCRTAGVRVFVKQIPAISPLGSLFVEHRIERFPSDLQLREFPRSKVEATR